jgi:hypothetical protein
MSAHHELPLFPRELPAGVTIRPRLRLSEVERLIKKHRIIVPCPSRNTLVRMCEDGTFETPTGTAGRGGWEVFEQSFWDWANAPVAIAA